MKMILFFKSRTFWFNLILAFVFLISLMLPLNWVLKQITGHGEIQNVPDVRNITLKEAQQTLKNMQLIGEVLDSSAFFKNFKPRLIKSNIYIFICFSLNANFIISLKKRNYWFKKLTNIS